MIGVTTCPAAALFQAKPKASSESIVAHAQAKVDTVEPSYDNPFGCIEFERARCPVRSLQDRLGAVRHELHRPRAPYVIFAHSAITDEELGIHPRQGAVIRVRNPQPFLAAPLMDGLTAQGKRIPAAEHMVGPDLLDTSPVTAKPSALEQLGARIAESDAAHDVSTRLYVNGYPV